MAASTARIDAEDRFGTKEHLPISPRIYRWADELDFPNDEILLRIRYR